MVYYVYFKSTKITRNSCAGVFSCRFAFFVCRCSQKNFVMHFRGRRKWISRVNFFGNVWKSQSLPFSLSNHLPSFCSKIWAMNLVHLFSFKTISSVIGFVYVFGKTTTTTKMQWFWVDQSDQQWDQFLSNCIWNAYKISLIKWAEQQQQQSNEQNRSSLRRRLSMNWNAWKSNLKCKHDKKTHTQTHTAISLFLSLLLCFWQWAQSLVVCGKKEYVCVYARVRECNKGQVCAEYD